MPAATNFVTVELDGHHLTPEELVKVARGGATVTLAAAARTAVRQSRQAIERAVASGRPTYGINTGFGRLSEVVIPPDQLQQLQLNLILSHAAGVGPLLDREAVRAAMVLRVNALCRGHSGIREVVLDLLCECVNRGVTPVVPSQGSLGASGDLAPLAHITLVLLGRGQAWTADGRRLPGDLALAEAGLAPVVLEAKEGLALINGTQVMTAVGTLALVDAWQVLGAANAAAALTMEALGGLTDAMDPRIQAARPHPGQAAVARQVLGLLEGSSLTRWHGEGTGRVQDAYSLRCVPQVHGAVVDSLAFATDVLACEINSTTDNPLVFTCDGSGDGDGAVDGARDGAADEAGDGAADGARDVAGEAPAEGECGLGPTVLSGGNFHGQPVSIALDVAAIALATLANIAERRVERLVNPDLSGLPAFLTRSGGIQSGLMLAQYTAAALVSENKILAAPASIHTITSSANQEDHVSMGTVAARKLGQVVRQTRQVVAIELLAGAQALDLRAEQEGIESLPGKLGAATARLFKLIRDNVPVMTKDRELAPDINAVEGLIACGAVAEACVVGSEQPGFKRTRCLQGPFLENR